MIASRILAAATRWRRTQAHPDPDVDQHPPTEPVESVRVLHCDPRLAGHDAAARVVTEIAGGLADLEQQTAADLSPFNAVIGAVADRMPGPTEQPVAVAAPPETAPPAPAAQRYGYASPWDLCWARLTDAQRRPNSHECAHPGCTERLALAVLLCPDHRPRKDPRRA